MVRNNISKKKGMKSRSDAMPNAFSRFTETRLSLVDKDKQLAYKERPTTKEDTMERVRIAFESINEEMLINNMNHPFLKRLRISCCANGGY